MNSHLFRNKVSPWVVGMALGAFFALVGYFSISLSTKSNTSVLGVTSIEGTGCKMNFMGKCIDRLITANCGDAFQKCCKKTPKCRRKASDNRTLLYCDGGGRCAASCENNGSRSTCRRHLPVCDWDPASSKCVLIKK